MLVFLSYSPERGINFDLSRDQPAIDSALSGQRVYIATEKTPKWSEIERQLLAYFPNGLKNEPRKPQTTRFQQLQRKNSSQLER